MTGGSKDHVTGGTRDHVTGGTRDHVTGGSRDYVTSRTKEHVTGGSRDPVTSNCWCGEGLVPLVLNDVACVHSLSETYSRSGNIQILEPWISNEQTFQNMLPFLLPNL